ncbi:unnamed protein product [Phytophthora fragariaefolia]|uniref:Unnamed protein product n=1 Tax=Phytophthora fragariaefolia TaxID=1490495 RepID=A0A9W6TZI5_9STRA|nr:unnamed protein product [Phytophthora fragariaefolia]
MPSQVSFPQHSSAEKRRVLDAYLAGRTNWLAVTANNGISRSMAYRIADTGRVESLPRWGARPSVTKVTSEVKEHLEAYLNDNCTYTMETMRRMLILDLGTEGRVAPHEDLEILRLAPYSPMCNPIEGCFSVLKAHIKDALALDRDEICDRSNMTDTDGNRLTMKERTIRFLECAARRNIKYITPAVVANMELHARDSVNAAEEVKDMFYGK